MSALLDDLVTTALAAGAVVMRFYEDGAAVAHKGDGSPVTEADEAAEALILADLSRLDASIPVVAEEQAAAGLVPASSSRFFLVDPVDGTKEFISRNGEFTVNIALVENGVPVAGVVYAPALGRLFAGAGTEAWQAQVQDGVLGARETMRVRAAPARLVAVGSKSHGSAETQRYLEPFPVERFVSRGSSLKFCLLAAGEADIYPRLGRTMEWDTAAGDAVLRAAGGRVATLDGAPLCYNKRDQAEDCDFANPHFVAFGDPAVADLANAADRVEVSAGTFAP